MIVLLMLYSVVMLELLFLNSLLRSLGMAEAALISNLLSVAVLGWVLVPPATAPSTGGYARCPTVPGGRWPPGSR